MVACYNENHTEPPISWRQVQSYNKLKVPLSGFINLSIACNHCLDAPCLKACPANAYQKDSETGAIIHHAEKCIGCTYCTWACPFDAPQYNKKKGVVEKCNFCNERLKIEQIPACSNSCPTGALSFNDIEVADMHDVPGMSQKSTRPRINFKNSEVVNSIPLMDLNASGYGTQKSVRYLVDKESKINALKEWPLAIFTLISSLLVGWIAYFLFDRREPQFGVLYATLGFVSMALSSLHLGKPFRAYRATINFRTSWLSREILLFMLFAGFSLIVFFINSSILVVFVSVVLGVLLLVSIEYVYAIADKKYSTPIHSANTILTAITFGLLLTDFKTIAVGFIVLKAILYIVRYARKDIYTLSVIFSFTRFFVGCMMPIVSILLLKISTSLVIIPFIVGELIDRLEFYNELHVDTPYILMNTLPNKIEKL